MRWEHQTYGHLLPSTSSRWQGTGLIVKLGHWVLEDVAGCTWREAYPQTPLAVSINISGRQLQGSGIADAHAPRSPARVDPSAVILEITESVLMQQTDGAGAAPGAQEAGRAPRDRRLRHRLLVAQLSPAV